MISDQAVQAASLHVEAVGLQTSVPQWGLLSAAVGIIGLLPLQDIEIVEMFIADREKKRMMSSLKRKGSAGSCSGGEGRRHSRGAQR